MINMLSKLLSFICRTTSMAGDDNLMLRQKDNDKEVAYYAAIVAAWITSSMERDKSILYIASGGIGLLITLATNTQAFTHLEFVFYIISLSSFLLSIVLVLLIFQRNTVYIGNLKENLENPKKEPGGNGGDRLLLYFDKFVLIFFGSGIMFSFGIAMLNLVKHPVVKENCMEEDRERLNSLNGLNKLNPQGDGRSLNGIEVLRPKPQQPPADNPKPKEKPTPAPKKD